MLTLQGVPGSWVQLGFAGPGGVLGAASLASSTGSPLSSPDESA